ASQLLLQTLPLAKDAREIARTIQRHTHRAPLIRERRQDRLTDPPHGVRDELHALLRIELPCSRDEPDVAFLDQVDQRDAAVLILLGDADDEAEVRPDELLHGLLIALLRTTTQLDLFLRSQQLMLADLAQVLIECRPLLGRTRKSFQSTSIAPLAPLASLRHLHMCNRLPVLPHQAHRRPSTTTLPCKDSAPAPPRATGFFQAWAGRTP